MTHPACGECKHCEMQEKDRGKLYLSAIFSSGYNYVDFLRWHDCSALYSIGCDTAVTGLKDCWCQRAGGIPGIWNIFPHMYRQWRHNWNGHESRVLSVLTKYLQRFQNWQKQWFYPLTCSAKRHISGLTERNLNFKWLPQRLSFPNWAVQRNTICKMAENAWAHHYHVIEWLSAQTCCFCRILWVPVKEMTQWYEARAHFWSPVIAHMGIRGSSSSYLDSSSLLSMF